jgi:hypothetical protein
MAFRFLRLALAAALLASPAFAADDGIARKDAVNLPLKADFGTAGDWRVIGSTVTSDADVPARVCFRRANEAGDCILTMSAAENGAPVINFSQIKRLKVVTIALRQKAVVLDALFPNDLRMAIQTTLWTYDRENDTFMPRLTFMLTSIGKYRIFASGPLAGHVVTAEFVSGENEGRHDGHRFLITAYRWMGTMGFVQVLSYVTPNRYDGETEDSPDEVQGDIFVHETPRIRALLKQVFPQTRSPKPE